MALTTELITVTKDKQPSVAVTAADDVATGETKTTDSFFASFSSNFLIFYSIQTTLCYNQCDCLHYRNPNSKDVGVEWPGFDPENRQFLEMRTPVRPGTDIFFKHFKMWLEKLPALMVWWFRLWRHKEILNNNENALVRSKVKENDSVSGDEALHPIAMENNVTQIQVISRSQQDSQPPSHPAAADFTP